jgi:hypothetical protein
MSYRESTSKIAIEPYCIFCGKPTDNVETYTRTDTRRSSTSSTHWDQRKRYIETTTTYNTVTIPFPAHPHCRGEIERANRVEGRILLGLVIAALGIAVFMGLYFQDLVRAIVALLGTGIPMLAVYSFYFRKLPSVQGSAEQYAATHQIEESAG